MRSARKYKKIYILPFITLSAIVICVIFIALSLKKSQTIKSRAAPEDKSPVLQKVQTLEAAQKANLINNGDFEIMEGNVPFAWEVLGQGGNLETVSVRDKNSTYVKNSALFVNSENTGSGVKQKISYSGKIPLFIHADVLVKSGSVTLIAEDEKGQQLLTHEVKEQANTAATDTENKSWQAFSQVISTSPEKLKSIKFVSGSNNSSWYITNVAVKPYQDFTRVFNMGNDSEMNKQVIDNCQKTAGDEYVSCIEKKAAEPGANYDSIGKPKVFYKGKELRGNNNKVLGLEANSSQLPEPETVFNVSQVLIATDFSGEFKDKILEYAQNSWQNEGINKRLEVKNAKVSFFDPTIATDCQIVGYWSKATFYMPSQWCSAELEHWYDEDPDWDKVMLVLFRIGGHDGALFRQKNRIFIDTSGDWPDIEYMVKHEIGHLFRAPDSDFVDIQGNALFPGGNSKNNSANDDIMYNRRVNVGDYTRGMINTDRSNYYHDTPDYLQFMDSSGQIIKDGIIICYEGLAGPPHKNGTISSSPHIFSLSDGKLDSANLLFHSNEYSPAYFFIIKSGNNYYKGQMDAIDMAMSRYDQQRKVFISWAADKPIGYTVPLSKTDISFLQIVNPKEKNTLNSLSDINIIAQPVSDKVRLKSWKLFLIVAEKEYLVSSGYSPVYFGDKLTGLDDDNHVNSSAIIYIEPEEIKNYTGKAGLKLTGLYSSVNIYPEDEYDKSKIPEKPIQFETTSQVKEIFLDNKPYIDNVRFYDGEFLINGKGFGRKGVNEVAVTFTFKGETEPAVVVKKVLEKRPYYDSYDPEEQGIQVWSPDQLQLINYPEAQDWVGYLNVVRDGISSNAYPFNITAESNSAKPPDSNLEIVASPNKQYYLDQGETISSNIEFRCLSKIPKVIYGLQTENHSLLNSSIPIDGCDASSGVNKKIIRLDKDNVDYILKNKGKTGKLYWYLCSVYADPDNTLFSFQDEILGKLLDIHKPMKEYYSCRYEEIEVIKQKFDISPTP